MRLNSVIDQAKHPPYRDGITPDGNAVKRVNRKFVAIRNDGGGNRSSDGMEAN